MPPIRSLSLVVAPLLLATACGGDDGASAPTAFAATTVAATREQASPTSAARSPASRALLPTADASTVRDRLLETAEGAPFTTGNAPDFVILRAWDAAFPGLRRTLFDDQEATPEQLSSSMTFLLDRGTTYRQLFAFAVLDTAGRCAGAVVVIPEAPDGGASDSDVPTVFEPVDVPGGDCTAEAAQEAYAEGST